MLSASADRRTRRAACFLTVGTPLGKPAGINPLSRKPAQETACWRVPGKKPDQIVRVFIVFVYSSANISG